MNDHGAVVRDFDPSACPRCGSDACDRADHAQAKGAEAAKLISFSFDELRTATFPKRDPLLCHNDEPVFNAGNLGEVYAPRGLGKSLFMNGVALAIATGGSFLRWRAPKPRGVLVIDGELPSSMIRERFMEEGRRMGIESCPALTVVGADWQADPLPRLDTPEGMAAVEPLLEGKSLVVLDNASCLLDPESEKDVSAWAPAQAWLLMLRRRGIASWLVHHANRQGGARGHSKREDVMDVILKLSRPEGYRQDQGARFRIEFDKARGFYGAAAEPFVAGLGMTGWTVEEDEGPAPRVQRLRDEVLAYVTANPGCSSRAVTDNIHGRATDIRTLLETLGESGCLRKSDGKWRVK